MRVMHGVWARGALCLWAEDPDLPPAPRAPDAAAARRIRSPARPPSWPTCWPRCPGGRRGGPQGGQRRADLQLPSAGRRAAGLARSSLRPGRAGPAARPGPARCQLAGAGAGLRPGRRAGPAAGSRTWASSSSRARRCPTWPRWPASPTAWPRAAGCCRSWSPEEREAYAARWRPVLGGADAQRARDLAAAMPPSCRAAAGSRRASAGRRARRAWPTPRRGPACRVRSCPPRRGRTPAHIPLAERYVACTDQYRCSPRRGDAAGRGRGGRRWPRSWTRGWTARGYRQGPARSGPASGWPSHGTRRPIPGGSSSRCSPPRTRA